MKFSDYQIEILNEPFAAGDMSSKQTALIRFYTSSGRLIKEEKLAVKDAEEVYNEIQDHKKLFLDNAYIRNFSLSTYKQKHSIDAMGYIHVDVFSAVNAFFESDDCTDFSYVNIHGPSADMVNARFAKGNVSFYKACFNNGDADFSSVHFGDGDVNFQYVEFEKGAVSFENSMFGEGDVSFVNTHFGEGKVNFKNVYFGKGVVDFHFAHFKKGDISFDKAVFDGPKVDFRRVEFGDGKLDFTRTQFGDGEVNFEETEYGVGRKNFRRAYFGNAQVSFELAQFGEEEVSFDNAVFGDGKLSFFKATAGIISFQNCHLNNYLDLRVEKCHRIDLSNTIAKDIIDLKPGFSAVNINELELTGMRNLGKIFITWKENRVYHMISSQPNSTNWQKAEQFRLLKEDFNSSGQYNDEDKAYVAFKRYELKHYKQTRIEKKKFKPLVYLNVGFQKLVFDRMGLYATDPVRVLRSMLLVFLFFSCIYMFLPYLIPGEIMTGLTNPEPLSNVTKSMYYSAVTFFTIGYGDYYPEGVLRWVACLEGFSGVFMMSYFTVAFVRKILR
jgi:hypothetical protein